MAKRLKVRVVFPDGKVAKVKVRIPKKNRGNDPTDDWTGREDAFIEGVAVGIASKLEQTG